MLEGKIRESISKSEAKALRNDGYLIANIYGKGQENIHCAFKKNDFIRAMKSKSELIFPVKVGAKQFKVVVQEYQKDPVTSDLLHVDLMLAQPGVEAKFSVPVQLKGSAKGLKDKGVLVLSKKRIKVKCVPEKIPTVYELDVSELGVSESILVRDLPAHEGVRVIEKESVAIVGVVKAK